MLKILGLLCIVSASGAVGFGYASAIRRQARQLQQLIAALEYMKSEIQFRMTPLPELFYLLGKSAEGEIGQLFSLCAVHLRRDKAAALSSVVKDAMTDCQRLQLSQENRRTLLSLSIALGKFDVEGQCRSLQLAQERLQAQLKLLDQNRRARCRSYETLGICAGLAVAVILL